MRVASRGTTALGDDEGDSMCDGIDHAAVGHGSAWGSGGDNNAVRRGRHRCTRRRAQVRVQRLHARHPWLLYVLCRVASRVQTCVICFLSLSSVGF